MKSMIRREYVAVAIWTVANFGGVGLLAFADDLALRIIGWIWVSFAITISGMVEIGGLFYHLGRSDNAAESDLDTAMESLSKKDSHLP